MNGNRCCLARNRIEKEMMASLDADILKSQIEQNLHHSFCRNWDERRHTLCTEFKLVYADKFVLGNLFFE